ncbi:MAG: hypothetical protein GWN14_19005, partial [candidate division Zixibacteria bacterium]|nr:hypothetical protein [candidate division Zixibacteria bacterium]
MHPGLEKLIPNIPDLGQKKIIKPVSEGIEGEDVTKVVKPDEVIEKAKKAMQESGQAPLPATNNAETNNAANEQDDQPASDEQP